MKKLILSVSMVFLLTGCTTIATKYTEPRVRLVRQAQYYSYSPYYFYMPCPFHGGFYFYWYPYSHYGHYGYPRYLYQNRYTRSKTSVITKKQLKKRTGTTTRTVVKKKTPTKSQPTQTVPKSTVKKKNEVKKKK